jgi:RimJ/RimL family protein N-acetyltransferase
VLRPALPISTGRLLLRPFTPDDAADVWAYQRLPEVARFMRWEPRDRRQSQESVEQMANERELVSEGDCLSFAMVWPESGKVVGQVELVWVSERNRLGEIGYVLNPEHQGKGLVSEAARAVLRLGFEELNLHRIIGRCAAANTASARVLERLGMRREAHFVGSALLKGAWVDELVYAILRHEWQP